MSRPLIITHEVEIAIDAAVASARQRPIPLDVIRKLAVPLDKKELTLADRQKQGAEQVIQLLRALDVAEQVIRTQSEHVLIPFGYRAAISYEQQPDGLCRHLSISVDTPGRVPTPEAVDMIAKAFGFRMEGIGTVWLEEFDPGHHAVNIVEMVNQVEPGHA